MKISDLLLSVLVSSALAAADPALPLVKSNQLRRLINKSSLRARVRELHGIAMRNGGHRAAGSPGSVETMEWIENQIPTNYYNVERQYFEFSIPINSCSMTVNGTQPGFDFCFGSLGQHINTTITAPLALVPNLGCEASDYTGFAGKIAFIRSGSTCDHKLQFNLSVAAGAIGIVSASIPDDTLNARRDIDLNTRRDLSLDDPDLPNVGVVYTSGPNAQAVLEMLENGDQPTTIDIQVEWEYTYTANVFATTKGGNQSSIITVGAHMDGVKGGPGINDNGSGTIAQIEVAKALSNFSVKNAIRFCWWGGEEQGLRGSRHYTTQLSAAEKSKIVMNLNFDMIASPNYRYGVLPGDDPLVPPRNPSTGSAEIKQHFLDFFAKTGRNAVLADLVPSSDHWPFLDVGIPVGGIFMGAGGLKSEEEVTLFGGQAGVPYDSCYHKACDDKQNVNYQAFMTGAKAMADAVATYGRSIKDFPFPRPAAV
ncbi:Leucyl aminopeptidase yscIV [Arthrobotrys megalospora]